MAMHTFTAEERAFLTRVAEATFSNPFAPARAQLDRALVGASPATPREVVLARVIQAVNDQVHRLAARGIERLTDVEGEERELLTWLYLFHLFHQSIDAFDELIPAQIERGDESVSVPFVELLLDRMEQLRLPRSDALRSVAMFYQLRRAFFFIHHELVGTSPCMCALREQLWQNLFTHNIRHYLSFLWDRMEDFSTLLLGETGTGKGTAAAAIGRSGFIPYDSRRGAFKTSFTRAFVALNLSQFPEALLESELFGHCKGAFTGAVQHHDGILSRCSAHGAVFLDEIGDAAIPVQIKLLQVLQERTFTPVGSHERKRFEGRVIAATHQPLDELRSRNAFRHDFYYRLCSDEIIVPPLRERLREEPRELEALCRTILKRLGGDTALPRVDEVVSSLREAPGIDYAWPGNVRELEQAIRRILMKGGYRGETHPVVAGGDAWIDAVTAGRLDARELVAGYCRLLYDRHPRYGDVAKITDLDWRTVKKHVQEEGDGAP